MTTHKQIVDAIIVEEQAGIDSVTASIDELHKTIVEATELIQKLRTDRDNKIYRLRAIEYNGFVTVDDINNNSLNVGDRVAIIVDPRKPRLDKNTNKVLPPRYTKSLYGTITDIKRVTINDAKIYKVEFEKDSGKYHWKKNSNLIKIFSDVRSR